MNKVISLCARRQEIADAKQAEIDAKTPFWNIFSLCLGCGYRWIGTVPVQVSLFGLECPQCHNRLSFASFIPDDYIEHLAPAAKPGDTITLETE